MATLNIDLYTLFLYISNATIRLPEKYKNYVFQDMAAKLIERGVEESELRDTFRRFDRRMEGCSGCGHDLETGEVCPYC